MNQNLIISNIKGGFGNQLFQFAAGYSYAQSVNAIYKVDLSFFLEPKFKSELKIDKLKVTIEEATEEEIYSLKSLTPISFWGRVSRKININSKYNKPTHYNDKLGFKPDISFFNLSVPRYLVGWFLKPCYFDNYRNDFLKQFMPNFELSEQHHDFLKEIKNCKSVSVHIRRGDYINNKIFLTKEVEYYNRAFELFINKFKSPTFFIFSDDIKWCRENINSSRQLEFVNLVNPNADLEEFFLMKNCKHNIIANSSFSWWAAYLNENQSKIVIAPKIWFKDEYFQNSLNSNPGFLMNWKTV